MKPTEEQVREFWEKLGVQLEHEWTDDVSGYRITDCICEVCRKSDWPPAQDKRCYPPIDLNNLFKRAVPKAVKLIQDKFICIQEAAMQHLFCLWLAEYWEPREEPISITDALFWAIDKVRKEEK